MANKNHAHRLHKHTAPPFVEAQPPVEARERGIPTDLVCRDLEARSGEPVIALTSAAAQAD